MTRQEFAALCKEKIVILDGATGSNLLKAGMPFGVCTEAWVEKNPEPLKKLQKDYGEAGSDIVYAPTFSANPIKLEEYGLETRAEELNEKLVALSRQAVGSGTLVAGDLTMTGQQLAPLGTLTLEQLMEAYRVQARALSKAGVDLLVVETMLSLAEARAALLAAREVCELPVMVTMSFGENGRTLYGTNARTALLVLQGLGADAVGVNCSAGPDKMVALLKEMQKLAKVPLIAKPNAGMPHLKEDGTTGYDMDAEVFAGYMPALVEAGAGLLGGCCGTDPSYIRLLVKEAAGLYVSARPEPKPDRFLTTERAELRIDQDLEFAFLDPETDAELASDYEEGAFDTLYDLLDEALDGEKDVAVLSLTASMEREPARAKIFVAALVQEAMQYTEMPLAFRLRTPEVLEQALLVYPGVAGVFIPDEDEGQRAVCQRFGACIL